MATIILKNKRVRGLVLVILGLLIVSTPGFSQTGMTKVACRVETDRDVLPAGDSQTVVIKVTLDAPPAPVTKTRPAVNLSLVLDRSGSMGGDKIEKAREAAIEAVRHLGPQDIFSLVVYDENVNTIIPAQSVENIEFIISKIRMIEPGGSTALFGGVSQGAAEIRKHLSGNFVHRIILLSDGLANVGPQTPEDLGRLGASLIKENISVTTVGVGTDYNEDLMARLSQKSDGNIYFVEKSGDLPGIFTAELGSVLNVVAKQVKLIIEVPEYVTPLSIIGREGRITGRQVELFMNQLYGNQEKYALVEVRLPETKNGKKMEIARARVYYENPFTKKREQNEGMKVAIFSRDEDTVKQSTNVSVVREYQLNLNALAQEKAIILSDKGQKKEAVETLKTSAAQLKSLGSVYDDEKMMEEADALEKKADLIEKEGMSKKSRKVLRTESYQMKNQQYEK
ncbi:MAG: VWA domain-containing protein [Proteobacteria bacterium]|nr:VWA domain-containing protein [Pseudomonadota bacterium]